MTEPLTMNRLIHAAVRRDLARLSAALEAFPDGDLARARALDRAFVDLRRELTHHHEGEDTHVWPMLAGAGVQPALLKAMEDEHHAMAESLGRTRAAMTALALTGTSAARPSPAGASTAPEPWSSSTCGTRRPSSSRGCSRISGHRNGEPRRSG